MGAVFSGAERTRFLTVQRLEPARYRPHVILGTSGDTLAVFRAAAVSCEVPRSPDGVALPHPISDDARAEVRAPSPSPTIESS